MNNKIYKKLFVGFGFGIIVLILTLFAMSQTYIQNLVYHERLSQMEEVTHQMFHSLEDVCLLYTSGNRLGVEQAAENAFLHALCHRPE